MGLLLRRVISLTGFVVVAALAASSARAAVPAGYMGRPFDPRSRAASASSRPP